MKKTNKKVNNKFEKVAFNIFKVSIAITIMGHLTLQLFTSSLNIEKQKVEKEIKQVQADIDGIAITRNEKLSFSDVYEVAVKNGYTQASASSTASR